MNSLPIADPFRYLRETCGVNLLRGISTTLIESDLFNILPNYCFGVHCYTKQSSLNVEPIEIKDDSSVLRTSIIDVEDILTEKQLTNREQTLTQKISEKQSSTSSVGDYEEKDQSDDSSDSSLDLDKMIDEIDKSVIIEGKSLFKKRAELPKFDFQEFTLKQEKREKSIKANKRKKIGTKHRIKFTRWRRGDDKKLYKLLCKMNETTSDLIHTLRSKEDYEFEDCRGVLNVLAKKCKWKGTLEDLLKRIKKITTPSDFSFREMKQLKRLLKNRLNGKELDLDSILLEFPGKEAPLVMSRINQIKGYHDIFQNSNLNLEV